MKNMRDLINAVQSLSEAIVHRDRFIDHGNTRRTVVAVNPTKAEWDKFFPSGAAGVYCNDGRVAVGDGDCLAHDVILDHAKIPQAAEKYRLQLCRTGAWVELWVEKDEWDDQHPTEEEVHAEVVARYGETIEQIEAQVRPALQRFMGAVPVRVVPLSTLDQQGYIEADRDFVDQCHATHSSMCGD